MIGPQPGAGRVDLLAVQRDDELLDQLAARRPLAMTDPDAAAILLQVLAHDVDEGLADLNFGATSVPEETSAPDEERVDATLPRSRRAARSIALAVALGAALSVSGVAAAVTGDPMAPYRAVGSALHSFGGDDLPATAADIAHVNKALAGTRAAIARGELAGVQAHLDSLRASLADLDLTDEQRAAIEKKLDSLQASLARAATTAAEHGRSHARVSATAPPGPRQDKGSATEDRQVPPGRDDTTGGGKARGADRDSTETGTSGKPADKPSKADKPAGEQVDRSRDEAPTGQDSAGAAATTDESSSTSATAEDEATAIERGSIEQGSTDESRQKGQGSSRR